MAPGPSDTVFDDDNLGQLHIASMLACLDVSIGREVLRWQLAGQDPHDRFRGLHISDGEPDELLKRPFGASWGETVTLPPEQERAFSEAAAAAARRVDELAALARSRGMVLPFWVLAQAFDLSAFDLDALLVCLAPALDLRYERLYAYLQDDVTRKRPSVNLVLDLLCDPGIDRLGLLSRFAAEAPLVKHHLLERVGTSGAEEGSLLGQPLAVDRTLVAWLTGSYQPNPQLGPRTALELPAPDALNTLLAADVVAELERILDVAQPVVVFSGPDCLRQEAAARLLAARVERPLLRVDLAAALRAGASPLSALCLALRDARLLGAVPFLSGWGSSYQQDGAETVRDGADPSPDLLAELCAFPGLVVISCRAVWQPIETERERTFAWLEIPAPDYAQRQRLWEHLLGPDAASCDVTALAGQFGLTSGQIRAAVDTARDRAAQRGSPLQTEDVRAAARAHSNPRLASLTHKIEPRYTWADIILPDDQLALLHEIVAAVRERPLVLEAWGVGRKLVRSAGVPILFAGPPGTGKTMAAEIIAGELGLDLYRIDLSTVVSKYIGETEKNLERIFSEAQSSNAILFFDEADAIFGKRSEVKDAHDRYANIEISYLLQRMEAYDGVTILATNLRANLDEAFTRRLQFAVDFPFPEEEYRLRIWQTLFPAEVPRAPDLDLDLLATRFRLAGGNIRNVIVSAAYLAATDGQQVTMQHLLHGVRRELQKMGRLVKEKDVVWGGLHAR